MSVQGLLAHIKAMRRNHLIIVLVTSAVLYGNGVLISDKVCMGQLLTRRVPGLVTPPF